MSQSHDEIYNGYLYMDNNLYYNLVMKPPHLVIRLEIDTINIWTSNYDMINTEGKYQNIMLLNVFSRLPRDLSSKEDVKIRGGGKLVAR